MKVLDREQAWAIHAAALEILEKVGFKMENRSAREMLAGAGCMVDNGDWVRMPAYVAEEALSPPRRLPSSIRQATTRCP